MSLADQIHDLAYLMAKTNRNMVLSKKNKKPHLRVGVMPLKVEQHILDLLVEYETNEEILIPHCKDSTKIKKALNYIIEESMPVVESFKKNGIEATKNFKKAMFIASLGAKEGEKINYFVPSYGIERISSFLNRYSKDTSSLVINPNLCGKDRLYEILAQDNYDLIGISTLPLCFKNDSRILATTTVISPNSIKILGGYNIEDFDINQLFDCFDLDLIVTGVGEETMLKIMDNLDSLDTILPYLPNIITKENKNRTKPKVKKKCRIDLSWDPDKEIPLTQNDLFHKTNYQDANNSLEGNEEHHPEEQLANNLLRLRMTDLCKGSCRWCAAPKRKTYFTPIEDIMAAFQSIDDYEGVSFEDNDFGYNKEKTLELCKAIVEKGYSEIPKVSKSRIDSVDPELLEWLAKAGFKKFGYGVESFNQKILDELGKGITTEQIHNTLNETFKAGITPIINLMLFSPWETESTLLETISQTIPYVERGACLNAAVGMNATYGSKIIESDKDLIIYENLFYDGMKASFKNPIRLRCLYPGMQNLLEKVLLEREEYKKELNKKGITSFSSHINTLCAFRTIYKLLNQNYSSIENLIKGCTKIK